MRKSIFLTFVLTAVFISRAIGQELPDILKQRGEIIFSFDIRDRTELSSLTKIISIDKVDGNHVTAYANVPEYLKFIKLGYEITLLPYPGYGRMEKTEEHTILAPLTTWNFYPAYTNYESLMAQFQASYPGLCNLDTIATLSSGRRLLMLKISDNVNTDEAEPEFLYTSSIHGDETTGYILLMHLADYLLSNYGTNAEATDLVNNLEIYICPLANPDGTYYGGNSTVTGARRGNANNVDLNRNYPDPQDGQHPDGNAWQAETVAFMNFAGQRHFVTAVNYHGGTEVFNYPWDTWALLHAENNWFYMVAREYADTVHLHAPSGYMDYLNNGITNGYAWYEVNGGRQDYMNYFHHCLENTIEVSDTKLLPASSLLAHWEYNWRSMIRLLKQAGYGVHGLVTNQVTGQPVAAKVYINGHDINNSEVYSSATVGDYHRMLKAGTYTLEFSADCYLTQTIANVVVTDFNSVTLNVAMVPAAGVTTAAASSVTGTTAVSGGNVICSGSAPVTARGVCWSTSANPTVAGFHTTDGSGTGIFTSQLTGLSPATTYHVRAYATSTQGTFYGVDVSFTTTCGIISAFPWNEGFENAGVIPNCWTQQQVSSSGINWTFITGSGNSHPAAAHGGTYNACLKDATAADNKTKLITPSFNLAGLPLPTLKFWHTQALWGSDQDKLSVYYRTSAAGAWTLLITYSANITAWTQETISLPGPSAEYSIAFEGNAKYGYGICLDDISVASSCASLNPVGIQISASAALVTTGTTVQFTSLATNGGASPLYQWKKNNAAVSAATGSTYNDVPVNGDSYQCVLTSGDVCVTGNPAVSNTITIQVEQAPVNRELIDYTVIPGQNLCFDALQNIVVAGNDHYFTVQAGANVTLIAGNSVQLLPGVSVAKNGRLWAYIAPSGPFCSLTDVTQLPVENTFDPPADDFPKLWTLKPNPAADYISLDYPGGFSGIVQKIQIMNQFGQLLHISLQNNSLPIVLSVVNLPSGVYLVHIITSKGDFTAKMIKPD